MVFGDRESFAIEAVFRLVHEKWTWGRLRFWVANEPIGDFEDDSVDLAASARWGRTFLAASSQRTRADLDELNASDLIDWLYCRFLASWRGPQADYRDFNRGPFELNEVGDASTRDVAAIIAARRGDGSDCIVVKTWRDERVRDCRLPPGRLDELVTAYCSWVESLPATNATR